MGLFRSAYPNNSIYISEDPVPAKRRVAVHSGIFSFLFCFDLCPASTLLPFFAFRTSQHRGGQERKRWPQWKDVQVDGGATRLVFLRFVGSEKDNRVNIKRAAAYFSVGGCELVREEQGVVL